MIWEWNFKIFWTFLVIGKKPLIFFLEWGTCTKVIVLWKLMSFHIFFHLSCEMQRLLMGLVSGGSDTARHWARLPAGCAVRRLLSWAALLRGCAPLSSPWRPILPGRTALLCGWPGARRSLVRWNCFEKSWAYTPYSLINKLMECVFFIIIDWHFWKLHPCGIACL